MNIELRVIRSELGVSCSLSWRQRFGAQPGSSTVAFLQVTVFVQHRQSLGCVRRGTRRALVKSEGEGMTCRVVRLVERDHLVLLQISGHLQQAHVSMIEELIAKETDPVILDLEKVTPDEFRWTQARSVPTVRDLIPELVMR
jgi:hypothetical protein